ncbi:MAG TPA: hypothetical protein PKA13_01940 [Geminicoccaceae bacterium]|nr:hypothetical protein [Geminicoccus sp.]HMU48504.1 hypothetical protein [Geminicoccaceae bacterium]
MSIGAQHFSVDGRLKSASKALVAGIDEAHLPKSVTIPDSTRLRQPDSGAALVVNSFANWRRSLQLLRFAGETGFRDLRFDARCPTGIRGTPPLLDLIAGTENTVVAVTARCTEYLLTKPRSLASAYDRVRPTVALAPWLLVLARLREDPARFKYVDAAGLLKHAVGLGQTFPNRQATLAYLYWEPADAREYLAFAEHRRELEELAAMVSSSSVRLFAQSFNELWAEWQALEEPAWLRGIVARLIERYSVAIAEPFGL